MDPARAQVDALIMTLSTVAKSNPDLDVRPFVAPVLDDAIDHIRAALGDDAVPQSAVDLMKFTTVPLRAADAVETRQADQRQSWRSRRRASLTPNRAPHRDTRNYRACESAKPWTRVRFPSPPPPTNVQVRALPTRMEGAPAAKVETTT